MYIYQPRYLFFKNKNLGRPFFHKNRIFDKSIQIIKNDKIEKKIILKIDKKNLNFNFSYFKLTKKYFTNLRNISKSDICCIKTIMDVKYTKICEI